MAGFSIAPREAPGVWGRAPPPPPPRPGPRPPPGGAGGGGSPWLGRERLPIQGYRGKWSLRRGGRIALALTLLDLQDDVRGAVKVVHDGLGVRFVFQVGIGALDLDQARNKEWSRFKGTCFDLRQFGFQRPIFDGHKCLDLTLAFD